MIKERDEASAPQSGDAIVADNPLSVASGRALDEIAADRDRVWGPSGQERPVAAEPRQHSDPRGFSAPRKIEYRPSPSHNWRHRRTRRRRAAMVSRDQA